MTSAEWVEGAIPAVPLSEQGPAPKDVVVGFGFWLFLLSDIVIFASLFAAYAVLSHRTAGGPTGNQLFDRGHTLRETACLLASSFACGLMVRASQRRRPGETYVWAVVTFLLG